MKYRGPIGALCALVLGVAGAVVFGVHAAQATGDVPVASVCNTGWYVNHDEAERKPTQTEAGLEFKVSDLVHRKADLLLADLTPGTFVADPAPDQSSFFSVEVRDDKGNYGTLRWNGASWVIVIGAGGTATAGTFTDANPVTLLTGKRSKWGSEDFNLAATKVVSFGVGYTLNPPGTVKTTVKSVTFAGTTYKLDCPTKPEDKSKNGEESRCDGFYTRSGTATHVWNPETRTWVEGETTWSTWTKQRELNEDEREKMAQECGFTPSPSPGTPSPDPTTPSPDPTTPSPDPTLTTAPATTEPPVPVGNETDGDLPKTGSATLLIAGGGLGLLAVGGLLLLLTIRRRREELTEDTAVIPVVR